MQSLDREREYREMISQSQLSHPHSQSQFNPTFPIQQERQAEHLHQQQLIQQQQQQQRMYQMQLQSVPTNRAQLQMAAANAPQPTESKKDKKRREVIDRIHRVHWDTVENRDM